LQSAKRFSHGAERMAHSVKHKQFLEMAKFRFQDLKIWESAIQIANELFDIADDIERKRLYRFADQLRGAGMSMSNNIAEGSGSSSKKEFNQFLNMARRSTFENANILILLRKRQLVSQESLDKLLDELDHLCRQITKFQNSLN
jgi:four helix bundle protein